MYMANINTSVGRFLSVANARADQLTSLAKGALCLPAIISGLPDFGKKAVGNVIASVSVVLNEASALVSNLVIGTIFDAVNRITGSITTTINSAVGAVASITGVIKQVEAYKQEIKNKVQDVKDFTLNKENCNFAAATLLNCITSQALSNVTTNGAVNISKGLESVDSASNKIAREIASPAGAINRTINKAAYNVSRAERTISTSNIF
tara:strand:- start:14091 stop:14714 length:624 start_codon:yes stop_codon:yes gene_type:complete